MHYQISYLLYFPKKKSFPKKSANLIVYLIKKLRRKKSSIRNQLEKYLNQNYPSTLNSNKY